MLFPWCCTLQIYFYFPIFLKHNIDQHSAVKQLPLELKDRLFKNFIRIVTPRIPHILLVSVSEYLLSIIACLNTGFVYARCITDHIQLRKEGTSIFRIWYYCCSLGWQSCFSMSRSHWRWTVKLMFIVLIHIMPHFITFKTVFLSINALIRIVIQNRSLCVICKCAI